MVVIRTKNTIINDQIEFLNKAQPDLDLKPGEVTTDLFIDNPANVFAKLYEEVAKVSDKQTLFNQVGKDLENYAKNFNKVKDKGKKSTGTAIFTFSSLNSDKFINKNDTVTAKNGSTFFVVNSKTISTVNSNVYKSTATKYKTDLNSIGNFDEFAIEILVEATSAGIQGNISKFSLISTSVLEAKVTNILPFSGGTPPQSDSAFKNQILSSFNAPGAGTLLSLKNIALEDPAVLDALVIEAGDELMIRDGTEVLIQEDGSKIIVSEGFGGKVDLLVFGNRVQPATDTYVFIDASNTGNATNIKNDFILGQILEDVNKTIPKKRKDNIANKILPNQPINNIISVVGSRSGANFIEKSVDSLGRISGNYELVKDQEAYGGSVFGFDKLRWISNKIFNFSEEKTKNIFNGVEELSFSDTISINKVEQAISISNDFGKINSKDKSLIQLSHFPFNNINRILNVTTGERYIVQTQNLNSGQITIAGNTLPSTSDILQLDYQWILEYDNFIDFDNLDSSNNVKNIQDSIDWGYSNLVKRENVTISLTVSYFVCTTLFPISSLISIESFKKEELEIILFSGRFAIETSEIISNISSIIRLEDSLELWDFKERNDSTASISNKIVFLPNNISLTIGQKIKIIYNTINYSNNSTINENIVTIPNNEELISGQTLQITYLANTLELIPNTDLISLPIISSFNKFNSNVLSNYGYQPVSFIYENETKKQIIKYSPTYLGITLNNATSTGVITISGTTLFKVFEIVYINTNKSLKQDLSSAIRKFLKINSNTSINANLFLTKIIKMEKVEASTDLQVLSSLFTYDIHGYSIQNNFLDIFRSVQNNTLKATEFVLPDTENNLNNLPEIGDKIRITFYYSVSKDYESLFFSKSTTLYSTKKYAIIDSINISSGFSNNFGSIQMFSLNQPTNKSKYKIFYDYIAPKQNERITIEYNYQKLIGDVTLNVESEVRRTGDDILVKSTFPLFVDATLNIAILQESQFKNSETIIIQNVKNIITELLNPLKLNTSIDSSDLVTEAYKVPGVDRVRVLYFNESGKVGSKLTIQAEKNQSIRANNIIVNIEKK